MFAALARSFIGEVESLTFATRDDAVYVEASVIRGGGKTILISVAHGSGHQLRRPSHTEFGGSGPAGGDVRRSRPGLRPSDPGDSQPRYPGRLARGHRALRAGKRRRRPSRRRRPGALHRPCDLVVDEVLTRSRDRRQGDRSSSTLRARSATWTRSGAAASRRWRASSVGPTCWKLGGKNTAQLVELLAAAVDGGHYVPDRTEGTPREP